MNCAFRVIVCFLLFSSNLTFGKTISHKTKNHTGIIKASLVVNAETGKILHQDKANIPIYPASLTKMMTLYLTFEKLKQKKIKIEDNILVSVKASKAVPSKLGLKPREIIKVHDAIMALIVKSANDAAITLAEKLGESEERFAEMMTKKAKQLGMSHTYFKNASGLPNPFQRTTAMDIAKLAIAIKRDFPEYYPLFSKTHFVFKGVTYHGHDRVKSEYAGAEGMKTGYIKASGFNLVTSAKRGNTRLVGVVIGGHTAKERDNKMMMLLDQHFTQILNRHFTQKYGKTNG